MKIQVGLWIDHKETVMVFLGVGAEEALHLESGMEKHVRFSGRHSADDGSADDQRDRQFAEHLSKYYDSVIATISAHAAESIFLFGPGEAKGELKKQLVAHGLGERIVGVETADKLTENQIAAKVRLYYQT